MRPHSISVSVSILAVISVTKTGLSSILTTMGLRWEGDLHPGSWITLVQYSFSGSKAAKRRQIVAWGASPRYNSGNSTKPRRGDR